MTTSNEALIGRSDVNDLDAILAVTNTDRDATIAAVRSSFDTVFTWDYEKGSRPKLNRLYEKAKVSMWNGETDLPWNTEIDQEQLAALQMSSVGFQQMDLSRTSFRHFGGKKLGLLDASDGWLRTKFQELGVIQFEDWADTGEEYEMFALAEGDVRSA